MPDSNRRASLVLGCYLAAAIAIGASPLQDAASAAGLRPGLGTALAVNVLLPIVAFALAMWRPRYATVWIGGLLLSLGFFVGAMFRVQPAFWTWTSDLALRVAHPILLAAAVGYGVVGSAGVVIARGLRAGEHRPPV